MPSVLSPEVTAALTVNGTDQGYVGVADVAPFYPGARVWLSSATGPSPKEYIITDLVASTIGLREILSARDGSARYGKTPVSQWTVAVGSRISQERQVVTVEEAHIKISRP